MTLGQKIKKLRTDKGITQKDLADKLHVTFQTVSKWENDENEPDISTIKELSKIFECSIDKLLSDEDIKETENENIVISPKAAEETDAVVEPKVVVLENHLHVCEHCKKDIPENDLAIDNVCVVHAGKGRQAQYRQAFYHKKCLEEIRAKRKAAADKQAALDKKKAKTKVLVWSIIAGAVGLAISLFVMIGNPEYAVGLAILYSALIGYAAFSMAYCIVSGSYLGDVFVWCATLSVKFPGIIFTWNLDGLKFLIIMKILFAVLGFIIGILALILAIVVSGALGTISFPFVLIWNHKNNYSEAL